MKLTIASSVRFPLLAYTWRLPSSLVPLIALTFIQPYSTSADGCFVFHWDKDIDIKEPAQKAIIVYDAGREDLLLQVKYEGPLEEFGWLVPVPGRPKIEKGSMQPFYELSQLTQEKSALLNGGHGDAEDTTQPVKAVEIKTVGAYEVAVLSGQDSGSLGSWLRAHDYSIPAGSQVVIDEYIHKGWYFIAAKIRLNDQVALRLASAADPKDVDAPRRARQIIQQQLSTGELHPLLINFDTPKCIYPLKISSVSGKPSEVSLYVLSTEPLLNKFIYDKAVEKICVEAPARKAMNEDIRNRLAMQRRQWSVPIRGLKPGLGDWSQADLDAIHDEAEPDNSFPRLDDSGVFLAKDLLQSFAVGAEQLPHAAEDLPRIKNRGWYLSKQVYSFLPEEMHDLEFQPAIPILAAALSSSEGNAAAVALAHLAPGAVPTLLAACKSTNDTERINASSVLEFLKDSQVNSTLAGLLTDNLPEVRYQAVMSADANWDNAYVDPLIHLFHDFYPKISKAAADLLARHEPASRAPEYVAMLRDPEPNVQASTLRVALRLDARAVPKMELLRLLGCPRLDAVSLALSSVEKGDTAESAAQSPAVNPVLHGQKRRLASIEAAPLTTNRLAMARIIGLGRLKQNADATAVELTLPLLHDANSIVRLRAVDTLQSITGQAFSQNESAKWEQWWTANAGTVRGP
jgi:HEAT repeat protein